MAAKRKPPKRSPLPATPTGNAPADFAAMLARAFARDGDNAILLNIQTGLDGLVSDVRNLAVEQGRTAEQVKNIAEDQREATASRREMHRKLDGVKESCTVLKTTVDRIAPLVDGHEREHERRRTEKAYQRKIIKTATGYVTKGRVVIIGLFGTGGLLAWLHWPWRAH